MSDIRIRVGAALDASVQKSFTTLGEAAKRAARDSEKEWRKTERELEQQAKSLLKAREKAERDAEKIVKQADREKIKSSQQTAREGKKAADQLARDEQRSAQERMRTFKELVREVERDARQRVQLEKQANREIERDQARSARAREREESKAAREKAKKPGFWGVRGGRIGIGRRAALGVSGGVAAMYGYGGAALSAAGSMLGVNTDFAGMAHQGIENRAEAQQIVNAAPSTTGMSVQARQSLAAGVQQQAQQVANDTASDTHDVLDAMRKFVALTGDLETARSTIGDIAKLSRATGSSLEDMSAASAEVANHLGDVPDRAGATLAVMRAIAGQGKLGALEIRDMAVQMAKLASQAPSFEGDTSKTIAILGAMAQESKLRGGSTSAAMAGTSVSSFASDISKGTTVKHWTAMGLNAFTDSSHTKLRSPEEIILEALKKTNGDQVKLGQLFPNKMGFRAVKGFASIYSEAGGGQAGLKAVDEEFGRLSSAAMTQEEVTRAFNAQMATSESQVQLFNNHMQQLSQELSEAAIPALAGLAPLLLSATTGLSEWVSELTGSGNKLATGNADAIAGQEGTTEGLINRSKKTEKDKNGHTVDVYSGAAVEVLKGQGANRAKVHGELEGQISKTEANLKEVEANANTLDPVRRAASWIGSKFGLDTDQQHAEKLRAELADLKKHNEQVVAESKRSNDLLRSISEAVLRGVARIDKPPPPTADRGGAAPPDMDQ